MSDREQVSADDEKVVRPELSPQGVMAGRVLRALRSHPLLEPVGDPYAIDVGCHARAISASVVTPDGEPIVAQVEQPEWWVARGPNWTARLSQRLAVSLREQLDARQS